jgi:hypothetical protein
MITLKKKPETLIPDGFIANHATSEPDSSPELLNGSLNPIIQSLNNSSRNPILIKKHLDEMDFLIILLGTISLVFMHRFIFNQFNILSNHDLQTFLSKPNDFQIKDIAWMSPHSLDVCLYIASIFSPIYFVLYCLKNMKKFKLSKGTKDALNDIQFQPFSKLIKYKNKAL